MAHLSQDPALIEAFNKMKIFTVVQPVMFLVLKQGSLTGDAPNCKNSEFWYYVWRRIISLSQELGIPRSEAQVIIDTYFERYAVSANIWIERLNRLRIRNMLKLYWAAAAIFGTLIAKIIFKEKQPREWQ
ncbi:MAG: hypothetical protein CM1200mP10_29480 [Candidatus Neomarinimicrobiota bacterium]|nr:MAG: hypothetical protein CM1200mP10_29480 [Candidatus Neomarinimicrobiota bacterium]